jgi:hypothetical protein
MPTWSHHRSCVSAPRVAAPQPLRPIMVTLGLISLLLLMWAAVQVA